MTRATIVFRKELIDALRDRRSLLSAGMYAIWAPVAVAFALGALARDRSADVPLRIGVSSVADAPTLVAFLSQQPTAHVVDVPDGPAAIRRGETDVVIALPPDYASRLAGSTPAPVDLYLDGASTRSMAAADRTRRLLASFARDVSDSRLLLRGIVPDVAQPMDVRDRDVSTAAERSARLLAMIPVFLLVAAFAGGMGVAIDATAGERERRSLESLLLSPVSPRAIVLGKWGAAAMVSAGVIVLMVGVTTVMLRLPFANALDLPVGLTGTEAMLVALILLPLALAAPAIQMLASVSAASYKEAQTHVSLLLLLPTVPGFLFAFGTLQDGPWLRIAPVMAQQLLMTDIMAGRGPHLPSLVASGIVTTAAAAAILGLTASLLTRERTAPAHHA